MKEYKILNEEQLGDIIYFINQEKMNDNNYASIVGPYFTITALRDMLFNGYLLIVGRYDNDLLDGIALFTYSNCYSNDTCITLSFATLDEEFIKYALNESPKADPERKFTKVKVFLDKNQTEKSMYKFFKNLNFQYELTYDIDNNFLDIYSYQFNTNERSE